MLNHQKFCMEISVPYTFPSKPPQSFPHPQPSSKRRRQFNLNSCYDLNICAAATTKRRHLKPMVAIIILLFGQIFQLTRNSVPTGCQAITRWFSETLFAKFTVQFGRSCTTCVRKPLSATTSISGPLKLFILFTCHLHMGHVALACSAMAGMLRHAAMTQRERVPSC